MLRVCPAEKIATDTGVEVVPRFYNSLVGNSKYKAEAESGVADTELAKLLGNKLRSTAITLYITGEASTGKSRIMQEIAKRTELPVIDVGLGYRLAARLMSKEAFTDLAELSARMRTGFSVTTVDGECRLITSSGNDITNELRSSEIDQYASEIGPEYDELILDFLRMHMNGPHLVAARNTALTKDAPSIVVDLTCEPIERAKRRAQQMKRTDVEVVSEELRQREAKSARHYTDKPEDALTIDTTTQSPETVMTTLVHMAISRIELMNGVRKEGDAK
jgi:cytidylate kinase